MDIEDRIKNLEKMMKEIISKFDSPTHNKFTQNAAPPKIAIKEESPREFLLKFRTKTDTEKTLVAINYLEAKGESKITIKEIGNTLKEMREKIPKNISDKIQLLDRRAFLKLVGQEGKRKNWIVSNEGEKFLERIRK